MTALLSIRDLQVSFPTEDGVVTAVDGLSLDVGRGRMLALVGESGCGKTAASLTILGLHNRHRTQVSGQILFDGKDLLAVGDRGLNTIRGNRIAMIFQDPLTALSPYHTVGEQIADSYRHHLGASRSAARRRAVDMLARVGIPSPRERAGAYPHQFSGGMRQRAMIAIALACDPDLLIADEPTTALDVTVQAQIIDLLDTIRREQGTAIIVVSHDLNLVASNADDVIVMYAGRRMEYGNARDVLTSPRHPYTQGLLDCVPSLSRDPALPLRPIEGTPPNLLHPLAGCPFHPRCAHTALVAGGRCHTQQPAGTRVACHLTEAGLIANREDNS